MNKVVTINEAVIIAHKLRKKNKNIVLAGGVFDILHIGHIKFLENAKKQADVLFVLLENDENVRKLKGKNRPINSQTERAQVLAALACTDYIITLENMKTNADYDKLITQIRPAVIATTQNDKNRKHKLRQAKLIKGAVVDVISRIKSHSTTKLAKLIEKDLL